MPGSPLEDKTPPMGLLTYPFCEAWQKHIETETKDLARHMFAHFGRGGELIEWPRLEARRASPSRRPGLTAAPALPASRAAPRARGQHEPSLVASTIGTRRWPGSYSLGHAHGRIGGTADPGGPGPPRRPARMAAATPAERSSPAPSSGGGSGGHRRSGSARPGLPSPRGSQASSALSSSSHALLAREVERVVRRAVSEAALPSPQGRA
mmetsp:Transcript_54090/g.167942  ORF Transcript_54090/g.167942 Transcript_54090/m.167942 type:complete len:209 (-) Transcript_54090:175-801(-)